MVQSMLLFYFFTFIQISLQEIKSRGLKEAEPELCGLWVCSVLKCITGPRLWCHRARRWTWTFPHTPCPQRRIRVVNSAPISLVFTSNCSDSRWTGCSMEHGRSTRDTWPVSILFTPLMHGGGVCGQGGRRRQHSHHEIQYLLLSSIATIHICTVLRSTLLPCFPFFSFCLLSSTAELHHVGCHMITGHCALRL